MLEQGYGLVRFYTLQDAQAAIEKFHGTELEGRTLTVRLDKCAPAPRSCLEQRLHSAAFSRLLPRAGQCLPSGGSFCVWVQCVQPVLCWLTKVRAWCAGTLRR